MLFCSMLLFSEKSETYFSYKNTCKFPPQKFLNRSVDYKWSSGCWNESRKYFNFSYSPGANLDRKVIKYKKKVVVFLDIMQYQYSMVEIRLDGKLYLFINTKIRLFYPKNNFDYFRKFLPAKHYQYHKKYSIFLLQSVSSHFKHINVAWKCLRMK